MRQAVVCKQQQQYASSNITQYARRSSSGGVPLVFLLGHGSLWLYTLAFLPIDIHFQQLHLHLFVEFMGCTFPKLTLFSSSHGCISLTFPQCCVSPHKPVQTKLLLSQLMLLSIADSCTSKKQHKPESAIQTYSKYFSSEDIRQINVLNN